MNKKSKYYYYNKKDNVYIIQKYVNSKQTYFDSCETKEEAEKKVTLLRRLNWDKKRYNKMMNKGRNINPKDKDRINEVDLEYIYYNKGYYYIQKIVNGKLTHYGLYKDLDTAMSERDLYKSCDWDWDRIVEEEIV